MQHYAIQHEAMGLTARLRKHLVSLLVVLSYLYQRWAQVVENSGWLVFDRLLYKGSPGAVIFDVEEDEADGYLLHRVRDEYHQWHCEAVYFRLSNRWVVRNRRIPGPKTCMEINSQALEVGFMVIGAQWHPNVATLRKAPLVAIGALPQDGSIERANAQRKRVQDFLARLFPASDNRQSQRLRDAAESILKQV